MQTSRGLTLIELIVALSVVSITLSMAIPSFSALVMNNRRTADISMLQTSINLARSEAVKRGYRVALCRTDDPDTASPCLSGSNWGDGWIVYADRDADGQPGDAQDILLVYPAIIEAADTSLVGSGLLADRLEYLPNGHLSATIGPDDQIIRCDKRGFTQARAIRIVASGHVSIHSHKSGTAAVEPGDCSQDSS